MDNLQDQIAALRAELGASGPIPEFERTQQITLAQRDRVQPDWEADLDEWQAEREQTEVITPAPRERVVSETGGVKEAGLACFSDIPAGPLRKLAERYGLGRAKYPPQANGRQNWEAGYDFSLSFSALQRHAWAFWGGENIDEETGQEHLVAVAWHAFALLEWCANPELVARFDDRSSPQGRGVDR